MHIIPIGLWGIGVICGYYLVVPVPFFFSLSFCFTRHCETDGRIRGGGLFFHMFKPGRYVPRHYVRPRGGSVCMNSYGKHERGPRPSACACVSMLAKQTILECVRKRGRERDQASWVRARDYGETKRPGWVGREDELWLVGRRERKKHIPKQLEFAWGGRCVVKRKRKHREESGGKFVEDDWG